MTDRIKEQLSAFLDGELPDPESALLLKRLERDDELRGALSRYSLIGAVLRSDGDVPAARQVAARVSAAIAREPARGARWLRLPRREAILRAAAGSRSPRAWRSARCCWSSRSGRRTRLRPMRSWRGPNSRRCSRCSTTPVGWTDRRTSMSRRPRRTSPAGIPPAELANYLVAHYGYASPLARRSVGAGLISDDDPSLAEELPPAETTEP